MRRRSNESGSMLIQILVFVGIMGVLVMGVLQLFSYGQERISAMQSKIGQLGLAQDIRAQISRRALCTSSLKTTHYSPNPTAMQFDLGGGRIVQAGQDLSVSDSIVVDSLNYVNAVEVETGADTRVYLGDLELRVSGSKGSKQSFASMNVGKIYLVVEKNTDLIKECYNVEEPSVAEAKRKACRARTFSATSPDPYTGPLVTHMLFTSMNGSFSEAAAFAQARQGACDSQTYPMTAPGEYRAGSPANSFFNITSSSGIETGLQAFGPYESRERCLEMPSVAHGFWYRLTWKSGSPGSLGGNTTSSMLQFVCVDGTWVMDSSSDSSYSPAQDFGP